MFKSKSSPRFAQTILSAALVVGVVSLTSGCDDGPPKSADATKASGTPSKKTSASPKAAATKASANPHLAVLNKQMQTRHAAPPPRDGRSKLRIGTPAPAFELSDTTGAKVRLADFSGKTVVLEWFNPECPLLRDTHEHGGLKAGDEQGMPPESERVVWLAINSTRPGERGADVELNEKARTKWKIARPVLLDPTGKVAQEYGARATPHIFIIDGEGKLAYSGAVDNAPDGQHLLGVRPVHHVRAALADLERGRPVAQRQSVPYGCGLQTSPTAP